MNILLGTAARDNPVEPSDWVELGLLAEFEGQRVIRRQAGGLDILLCRQGSDYYALLNRCTHLGWPLDGGRLMADRLHCPFHGACFDIKNGKAMAGPALHPLQTFAVKIEGDRLFVAIPAQAPPACPG